MWTIPTNTIKAGRYLTGHRHAVFSDWAVSKTQCLQGCNSRGWDVFLFFLINRIDDGKEEVGRRG